MDNPTYVTLSAQLALQKQLEVVANNVANTNTSGFKADRQLFQSYVEQLDAPGGSIAFVQDRATYIDQQSGPLQSTGNPLDVAIQGAGYLAVAAPQGTLYTRDGRLHSAADGTLVDSGGRPVLAPDGTQIQLPENWTNLQILGDGTVMVTLPGPMALPQVVGQIGAFLPNDPLGLRKSGSGLFTAPAGAMQPVDPDASDARIIQGVLEGSTVEPVKEIANMTQVSRAYEALAMLLGDDDERVRTMIQTLGTPT
jgi:flagellar basal-body rod protein FlgF